MAKTPDKVISLYKNTVKIEYYDRWHQYFVNGTKAIGVTTITGTIDKSRVLIYWAIGLAKTYLIEKCNNGGGNTGTHRGGLKTSCSKKRGGCSPWNPSS